MSDVIRTALEGIGFPELMGSVSYLICYKNAPYTSCATSRLSEVITDISQVVDEDGKWIADATKTEQDQVYAYGAVFSTYCSNVVVYDIDGLRLFSGSIRGKDIRIEALCEGIEDTIAIDKNVISYGIYESSAMGYKKSKHYHIYFGLSHKMDVGRYYQTIQLLKPEHRKLLCNGFLVMGGTRQEIVIRLSPKFYKDTIIKGTEIIPVVYSRKVKGSQWKRESFLERTARSEISDGACSSTTKENEIKNFQSLIRG